MSEIISPDLQALVERVRQAQEAAKSTGMLKPNEVYDYQKEKAARDRTESLAKCGIYARYAGCTFEAIEAQGIPPAVRRQYDVVKQYAQDLNTNLKNGTGLILRGHVGTMKTTLAVAVLHALLATDRTGFIITMPSLLDTIFTLKEKNTDEWLKFETKLRETPLLVLDDLGAEYASGWVLNKVDAIISERYNRLRPIIITTNLTGEQMKSTYTERVIDRMRSTCIVVTFSGGSLRQAAQC